MLLCEKNVVVSGSTEWNIFLSWLSGIFNLNIPVVKLFYKV